MYASALVNLALLKEETGDLEAAEQLLDQALKLRRAMFGPASIPYADTAFGLGRVLLALDRVGGGGKGRKGGGWFGGSGRRRGERALALMGEAVRVIEDSGEWWWWVFFWGGGRGRGVTTREGPTNLTAPQTRNTPPHTETHAPTPTTPQASPPAPPSSSGR